MYAIQIKDVVKEYKNGVQALSGLNLSVKQGELFSLLGKNGAGKSTLIRILTTYLKPTSGHISMFGKDIEKETATIRPQIACVSQQTSIDTYLSLEENMIFQSRLYKIPKTEAFDRMERLIKAFELEQYRKYPVSSYSGGVKRRLDIALNMMTKPKLLFLDEPTVGMDIQSRRLMWEMIDKIRNDFGTTVFLTTHYLEEADNLSDTICIMKDGKEVIQGTSLELRSYLRQDTVQIHFSNVNILKQYLPKLKEYFCKQEIYVRNTFLVIHTYDSKKDMEKAVYFLLQREIPFTGIEITQPTLEDVFLRLTSKSEGNSL